MSHHVEIEIEINSEVELIDVVFSIHGQYYPATYWEPAEYPEIEINEVRLNDRDIVGELTESELEEIDSKCWDTFNEGL